VKSPDINAPNWTGKNLEASQLVYPKAIKNSGQRLEHYTFDKMPLSGLWQLRREIFTGAGCDRSRGAGAASL